MADFENNIWILTHFGPAILRCYVEAESWMVVGMLSACWACRLHVRSVGSHLVSPASWAGPAAPAAGRCGAVWSLIPFVCKFKRFLSRLLYCVLLTKATNSVKPFLYLSLSILIINNNGLKASNNDLKPLCPHLLLYHLEGNLLNTSLFYLCSGKVQWLSIVLRYGSGSGSGQLL